MTKQKTILLILLGFCLISFLGQCGEDVDDTKTPMILRDSLQDEDADDTKTPMILPDSLPFELTREDAGESVSDGDVIAFTKRITGAWKNADFFKWLRVVTYGFPRDNPQGMPYYACLWSGVAPVKEGNKVTFTHQPGGSAENIMIPNPVLLTNVMALYKFTGNDELALLADELARGISAKFMGSVWDDNVPEEDRHIMARSVINNNFEGDLGDGRLYAVDYSAWHIVDKSRWNTEFVHIPNNPYWGSIYIQNKRSKDDVCHLFRAAGMIVHMLDIFDDPRVYEGVGNAYLDLKAFAADIVDNGFRIRTVDHDGTIYIPEQDLASFVMYGDDSECNARLSSALLGYSDPLNINCGSGISTLYEEIATGIHLFNYDIIHNFHMAAILHSLNNKENELAYALLQGLVTRVDADMEKIEGYFDEERDQERFNGKLAGTLVKYAACGLPLTSKEVRFTHKYYDNAIEVWNGWEYWDLWDESVPDGKHPYKPGTRVSLQDMTSFLQLCASPYFNKTGARVVDCDIIKEPSRWGE